MLKQIEIEKVNTLQITSKHSDFNSKYNSWQEAYFQIMAYQNTWSFAYRTAIESTRDHEAYLWILLKPTANAERITEWLTDLGYGNLQLDKVTVGEMDTCGLDVDYIEEA